MPKKLKEREISTSVSQTVNKENVKEELTQLLFKSILKRGISLFELIVIITIISIIITYIYNK